MKTFLTLLTVFFISASAISQGQFITSDVHGNTKIITLPEPVDKSLAPLSSENFYGSPLLTNVRWETSDPSAIGGSLMMSGYGNYAIVPWNLNNRRVCLYDSNSSAPVWTYYSAGTSDSYTAISDSGTSIVVGSYKNIMLFSNTSSTPVNDYSLTNLPDTGVAGPVDITNDGGIYIGCANRSDTSTVICFEKATGNHKWKIRIPTAVQGIKISGNDSLVIVNTYSRYWVINIYTGAVRYENQILYGTQTKQGISGDGTYIATINYRGYLNVYEWNGSSYAAKWAFQEPPGTYYNWITSVDISNDGQYVVVGELIFLSSSSYDGKVRHFKISQGSTPLWTFSGCGDNVPSVQISDNNKIVTAASWGDLAHNMFDLMIFKATATLPVPIFGLKTNGSLFFTSLSNDGRSVIATGKAVHARIFGSGGLLYNIAVDTSETPVGIKGNENLMPSKFEIHQNYPNPFNPFTIVKFDVARQGNIRITVYNSAGREIETLVNGTYPPGRYSAGFDASRLPSGVYFCRMETEGYSGSVKMVIVK